MSTHSGHAQKPSTSTVSTRKRRGDEERGSEATIDPSRRDAELDTLLTGGWDRFTRKGKKNIGVLPSFKAFMTSSWLMSFIVFIPVAWVGHYLKWNSQVVFLFCFLAVVPLEHVCDFGGEQMALYCGKDLGDLITVTLNNAVEAALAIILLIKCELKLLQSTVLGVVILHLLLVPGVAFMAGGARQLTQELHPHLTQLNHTLLTIGVLSLLLPAAFFAGIDSIPVTAEPIVARREEAAALIPVSDASKAVFLGMSRGIAIMLLAVYVASRIYLHNPPGEDNILALHPLAPQELIEHEKKLASAEPEVNQYVCIVVLIFTIGILATTAEFLVETVEFVREEDSISEEWFGLVLLPFVSFAADGFVAGLIFIGALWKWVTNKPLPISTVARARAIDLSIQFTLFWMPALVLLGWWSNKPLTLLFDFFEVACLLGATFLVNYVTADSKTNWAEGFAMVAFYFMIALTAWYYTGQAEIKTLSQCQSVFQALASPEAVAEH
ncbi:hypothetical protein BDN72DRAFT_762300 [Pluteus cervinus]|uniref:Uncharacterized protein n=1 Tax=Pluteus cervinus TaxID=181527 RepID=A0ACD3B7Q8_9AGAR|nr:hypothetical protein BDN72DRAFT_762300 [Pluteus cervinus]